jgi:hypothetical protein
VEEYSEGEASDGASHEEVKTTFHIGGSSTRLVLRVGSSFARSWSCRPADNKKINGG